MTTEESVAPEQSPTRELIAILLAPALHRVPLPDLEEIKQIIELGREPKPESEVAPA